MDENSGWGIVIMLSPLLCLVALAAVAAYYEEIRPWLRRRRKIKNIKQKIILSMRNHGVDVVDIKVEIRDNDVVPISRKLGDGTWLPILTWSFVSFDPTQSFTVPLD
jgi:hypothetical protein